jgi:hypothetical protein
MRVCSGTFAVGRQFRDAPVAVERCESAGERIELDDAGIDGGLVDELAAIELRMANEAAERVHATASLRSGG